MGIFDGPLFDLNGDGKTDAFDFGETYCFSSDLEYNNDSGI